MILIFLFDILLIRNENRLSLSLVGNIKLV